MNIEKYKKKMEKLGYITIQCECGHMNYKATVSDKYCSWCGKKVKQI